MQKESKIGKRIAGGEEQYAEFEKITQKDELSLKDANSMKNLVLAYSAAVKSLLEKNGISAGEMTDAEREFIDSVYGKKSKRNLQELIFSLYKHCYDRINAEINPVQGLEEKIVFFIRQNYDNPLLGIQMIADEFELSKEYIARQFKAKQHIRINDYINRVRVDVAKKYLNETDYLITNISKKVGFSSYRTFVRVFVGITGTSPKNYRNKTPERT